MEHSHIDEYANLNSPLHRIDPRIKLVSTIVFVVVVVLLDNFVLLFAAFALVLFLTILSKVPLLHVFKRAEVVLPFIIFVAIVKLFTPGETVLTLNLGFAQMRITGEGIMFALLLLLRVMVAALALILLSSTTKFSDLLRGMSDLRVPKILVQMLSFTYRYLFLFVDEAERMVLARKAKNFNARHLLNFRAMRTIGYTAATIFLRSYDRADRIYDGMLSKGYDSRNIITLTKFSAKKSDGIFLFLIVFFSALLLGGTVWM